MLSGLIPDLIFLYYSYLSTIWWHYVQVGDDLMILRK